MIEENQVEINLTVNQLKAEIDGLDEEILKYKMRIRTCENLIKESEGII
jgi:hypothetical protein